MTSRRQDAEAKFAAPATRDTDRSLSRRNLLLAGITFAAALAMASALTTGAAQAQQQPAAAAGRPPNILVIWGDDIGIWNISHNNRGMMGYMTPNIDRIAREGLSFTDYYGQQSCTAGRAAFIGGNVPVRTGMTKVGLPGAKEGWQKTDVTIATVMKSRGYATGQFGKTTRATATNTCRRSMASMSSLAISITSMPRRSRKTGTTRRTRNFERNSVRVAFSVQRRTRTERRPSRTPAR